MKPHKLKEPNILLASNNCRAMIKNVQHLLDAAGLTALTAAIEGQVRGLFALGDEHLTFARTIPRGQWRQRVSRAYYGMYNIRRAVMLDHDGRFSTDVSDHNDVKVLPSGFVNLATYASLLHDTREDRNMADYGHLAQEADLVRDTHSLINEAALFRDDAAAHLRMRGYTIP